MPKPRNPEWGGRCEALGLTLFQVRVALCILIISEFNHEAVWYYIEKKKRKPYPGCEVFRPEKRAEAKEHFDELLAFAPVEHLFRCGDAATTPWPTALRRATRHVRERGIMRWVSVKNRRHGAVVYNDEIFQRFNSANDIGANPGSTLAAAPAPAQPFVVRNNWMKRFRKRNGIKYAALRTAEPVPLALKQAKASA